MADKERKKFNKVRFALFALLILASPARAEQDEISVGMQAGLLLPAFSPTSATAFTLATWTAGIYGNYGILDDLTLTASFTCFMFEGEASDYRHSEDGLDYTGNLRTKTRSYHPQVGVKYKVFSGYDIAPYVDASIGYAWTTFHGSRLLDENNAEYDVQISDFGQGVFTVTAGISVDYRIANMVFVGLGFSFTYAIGDGNLLEHYFSLPIQAAYYW